MTPPQGNDLRLINAHLNTLKVTSGLDPDMTVEVSAGVFWLNGKELVEFDGATSGTITAPSGDSRLDLVVINNSGTLQVVTGAEALNPVVPDCPSGCVPLAVIDLGTEDTKITNDMIYDIRGSITVLDNHASLSGLTSGGCHPISAITGLQTELDSKIDSGSIDLSGKADVDGTPSATFTLNSDAVPAVNATIMVERDSADNTGLRWDESGDQWVFTNDGSTWNPIGTSDVSALTDLTDTPADYSGASVGDYVVVNGTTDGVEFATPPTIPSIFVSTEQTGTGSSQNIAHGLGSVPSAVFVSVTDDNSGAGFVVAEGAHDGTDVIVTVTTDVKFKVLAVA